MQSTQPTAERHHMARLNRLVQLALLVGISLSMALMITGAVLYFINGPGGGTTAVLPGLLAGNSLAYMVLGLIVLMITPALRVCVAAVGYMLDGQWGFALISAGVVAVLAVSVLIGAA